MVEDRHLLRIKQVYLNFYEHELLVLLEVEVMEVSSEGLSFAVGGVMADPCIPRFIPLLAVVRKVNVFPWRAQLIVNKTVVGFQFCPHSNEQ